MYFLKNIVWIWNINNFKKIFLYAKEQYTNKIFITREIYHFTKNEKKFWVIKWSWNDLENVLIIQKNEIKTGSSFQDNSNQMCDIRK